MGKYEFFEGQELSDIWWDATGEYITVGSGGVVSIKVCMESGQMAGVPWAVAFKGDGRCLKYNLALASGVELALGQQESDIPKSLDRGDCPDDT